jgi:hypothetical protein
VTPISERLGCDPYRAGTVTLSSFRYRVGHDPRRVPSPTLRLGERHVEPIGVLGAYDAEPYVAIGEGELAGECCVEPGPAAQLFDCAGTAT